MRRYVLLLLVQLRTSMLLAMQYRWDFFLEGLIEAIWTLTALVPLMVVYRDRAAIAGWTFPEALLVVGWFTLLQGVLEGAINPSVTQVVEHVRKGTLDFLLLKPADAQFLVSTARFQPWRATNVLVAIGIFVWAFSRLGRAPTALGLALAALLFVTSVATLYAFWILTVSAAFVVVRVDNLTYLFSSIFDAARWPISVFRGALRLVFTFVIPLAVLTTFPAEALLGRLPLEGVALSVAVAAVMLILSRFVWTRAIGRYTSASS
jgi:ABC-2 type transport system permease protein